MQLVLRDYLGAARLCHAEDSVLLGELKRNVAGDLGVEVESIELTAGLRPLEDDLSLFENGITDGATLNLCIDLLGGAKKKKKKTYSTPKKLKHKKKKVKLAILKCYKVDGSGKVSRLRKECPSASCGAGVFMAKHEDRTHCGRCTVTYLLKKNPAQ